MTQLSDYDPSPILKHISAGFITNHLWVDITVLLIVVVCLTLSAIFSASETSLSTANTIRLKKLAEEKKRGARKAMVLIDNYDRTLTTILIGNNLVNIAASTTSVFIFTQLILNPSIASVVSTIVMTLLVIIFGEILPKSYAKANATKLAMRISGLMWVFYKLFYPLAIIFMKMTKMLKSKEASTEAIVTQEELDTIIDEMEDQGVIDEDHADLLQGALSLGNKSVNDIMTPRVDMVAIEANETNDQILEKFFDSQYSRLPVYEDDKDNILGILQEKDFLEAVIKAEDRSLIDIKEIITTPLYVTKTTKVDDLIKEMQDIKKHFAIVSDEYGGTAGIVTMEDALEELVGEIYDEYDEEDEVLIESVNENEYIISSELETEELYELLDVGTPPEMSYATVGGLIYELCEGLPEVGKVISLESTKTTYEAEKLIEKTYKLSFELTEVENRRIRKMHLTVEDITGRDVVDDVSILDED